MRITAFPKIWRVDDIRRFYGHGDDMSLAIDRLLGQIIE